MKSKRLLTLCLLGLLLFVAACAPSSEAEPGATDAENPEEDEHTHSPSDHMAGAHDVPEEAAAEPNPIAFSDDSATTGGELFATNCTVCHGEKGLGDGPSAEALETKPANLTAGHVQVLSDGALFYIISHGRPETAMPAWEGTLSVDDRWNVVNFLRTLPDEEDGDDHADDEHMDDDDHMEGDDHAEDEHMGDDDHMEEDEHTEDEHMESDGHAEEEHSD